MIGWSVSQGNVTQQTQEVDNAETAAAVAIDDRESAVKKLASAQRALEDAKGKQQHSLQVTASPSALPEVNAVIAESQISAYRCLGALGMPQYCLQMFSLPPDNPQHQHFVLPAPTQHRQSKHQSITSNVQVAHAQHSACNVAANLVILPCQQ